MTEILATYIWYLVVAGPGGGMAVMPSAFETRDECDAAIAEYQKQPTAPGWSLACIPSAADFMDGGMMDEPPADMTPPANQ